MVEFRVLRFKFRVGILRKSSVSYASKNLRGTVANNLVVTMLFRETKGLRVVPPRIGLGLRVSCRLIPARKYL